MAKDIEFKFDDMDIDKLIKLKKSDPKKYKQAMKQYEDVIADMLGCFTNALSGIKITKTGVKKMQKKPKAKKPEPVKK